MFLQLRQIFGCTGVTPSHYITGSWVLAASATLVSSIRYESLHVRGSCGRFDPNPSRVECSMQLHWRRGWLVYTRPGLLVIGSCEETCSIQVS